MFRSIFISAFVLISSTAFADVYQDYEKTLTVLKDAYLKRYGLFEYKRQKFGWDAERQFQILLKKGKANPNLTVNQAQALVVEFVRSTRDYHGRALVSGKPYLKLGIWVRSIAGHVFVVYTDPSIYSGKAQVGDEMISFDGVTAYRALLNVSEQKYPNMLDTDQRDAERILTERYGMLSDPIPTAPEAKVTFRRGTQVFSEAVAWKGATAFETESAELDTNPIPPSLRGMMASNPHGYSPRVSYLPKLGQLIWEETNNSSPFYAWISKLANGKRVGMIRIPTFAYGSAKAYTNAVQAFAKLVEKMNLETDVLILDTQANRGGMIDYSYALASFFFNSNIESFRFQYRISSDIVNQASSMYSDLMNVHTLEEAYAYFEATDYCGYPIDMDLVDDMKAFALGIITDAKAHLPMGKARYYNTSKIKPYAGVRYLKPLIVTVDGWTASSGDSFAALLQDNYRATIVGTRTAGAGAFTGSSIQLENPLNFYSFTIPIALGYRYRNGLIENVAIDPDFRLDFTLSDLRDGKLDHYRRELERIASKLSGAK